MKSRKLITNRYLLTTPTKMQILFWASQKNKKNLTTRFSNVLANRKLWSWGSCTLGKKVRVRLVYNQIQHVPQWFQKKKDQKTKSLESHFHIVDSTIIVSCPLSHRIQKTLEKNKRRRHLNNSNTFHSRLKQKKTKRPKSLLTNRLN